jgi:hypothetical protein
MNNDMKYIEIRLESSHSKEHLGSAVPRIPWEQAIYEVVDQRLL